MQWRFTRPIEGYISYNIPLTDVFTIQAIAETSTATGSWKVYSHDNDKARFQYSQNTVSASFPAEWPLFIFVMGQ